jgi:hypothetical protein
MLMAQASSFKKSKFSFWPLVALVNDVPYKLRNFTSSFLICGLGTKIPVSLKGFGEPASPMHII